MIDISQLTSLVSAFRVETEKESISPEPSARQSLQHESLRQRWRANSKPLSNCRQAAARYCQPARHRIDGRGAVTPAISAVQKLLVQVERRVKLA